MANKTISNIGRKTTMNNNAAQFATSMRGGYIIAQALHYGIEALKQVPMPYREVSNIQDMEYLIETIYQFPISPEAKITEVESLTANKVCGCNDDSHERVIEL